MKFNKKTLVPFILIFISYFGNINAIPNSFADLAEKIGLEKQIWEKSGLVQTDFG